MALADIQDIAAFLDILVNQDLVDQAFLDIQGFLDFLAAEYQDILDIRVKLANKAHQVILVFQA